MPDVNTLAKKPNYNTKITELERCKIKEYQRKRYQQTDSAQKRNIKNN